MSDDQLRALERQVRDKKDHLTNQALKRAQERTRKIPIGAATITELADRFIFSDIDVCGEIKTIAWFKANFRGTYDELFSQIKGGILGRIGSLFGRTQKFEFPDTRTLYALIIASDLFRKHPDYAEIAERFRQFLRRDLDHFLTGTRVSYNGSEITITHRFGTTHATSITIPNAGGNLNYEDLNSGVFHRQLLRSGTLQESILHAFFGEADSDIIRRQFEKIDGRKPLPTIYFDGVPIEYTLKPGYNSFPIIIMYRIESSYQPYAEIDLRIRIAARITRAGASQNQKPSTNWMGIYGHMIQYL